MSCAPPQPYFGTVAALTNTFSSSPPNTARPSGVAPKHVTMAEDTHGCPSAPACLFHHPAGGGERIVRASLHHTHGTHALAPLIEHPAHAQPPPSPGPATHGPRSPHNAACFCGARIAHQGAVRVTYACAHNAQHKITTNKGSTVQPRFPCLPAHHTRARVPLFLGWQVLVCAGFP